MTDAVSLSEALLEQGHACHWVVDPAGLFQRIYGDPSEILGKRREDLLGCPLADIAWQSRHARVFKGESLHWTEKRGPVLWSVSVFPMRIEGVVRFAAAAARRMGRVSGPGHQSGRAHSAERDPASRFLHDSVGQNLTALGLQLDLVRMELEAGSSNPQRRIYEMQQFLAQIMEEVRNHLHGSGTSKPALENLLENARKRFRGTVELSIPAGLRLDSQMSEALTEIALDIIESAVDRSACSRLDITVQPSGTITYLEIRTDGTGFRFESLCGRQYAARSGFPIAISCPDGMCNVVRVEAGQAC